MFSHRSVFGEYSRTCWFRHVLCLKDHLVAGFQKLDNSIVHQRGEIDAFRNQKDKDRKQPCSHEKSRIRKYNLSVFQIAYGLLPHPP